jgi:hypothetical protein
VLTRKVGLCEGRRELYVHICIEHSILLLNFCYWYRFCIRFTGIAEHVSNVSGIVKSKEEKIVF